MPKPTKTVYEWCDLPIIKRPRKKKKQKKNLSFSDTKWLSYIRNGGK